MVAAKIILGLMVVLSFTESANAMEKLRQITATVKQRVRSFRETNVDPKESLLVAARRGAENEVIAALDAGAKLLDAADTDGNTIFHIAAQRNHYKLLWSILREDDFGQGKTNPLGAQKKNHKGQTPLHIAVRAGNFESVRTILAANDAGINDVDEDSNTALHEAVQGNYPLIVRALLGAGASVIIENSEGHTALSLIRSSITQNIHTAQIAHLLLGKDSTSLEQKDDRGDTNIQWAIKNEHLLLLKAYLLHASKDARKNKNHDGKTAKDLAKEMVHGAKHLFYAAFRESSKRPAGIIEELTIPFQDNDSYQPANPQDTFHAPSSSVVKPQATVVNRLYDALKILIASAFASVGIKLGYDYFNSAQADHKEA